jgi:hypothetical protein
MNRYWKLLNWEITRFGKFYAVLLLITLISQLTGVVLYANHYMDNAHMSMVRNSLSLAEYALQSGMAHFEYYSSSSLLFIGPIFLCGIVLLLYIFLIWYREWFSKNTFAYRLLMLPTSRMNVYAAKMSAIMLFVLGLIAFQLMILPLQVFAFNSIIPDELRDSLSLSFLLKDHPLLSLLIPHYFIQFVLYYMAGLMGVIVVFTGILLERSFRLKGMAAGVAYVIAAGLLFLSPLLIAETWFSNYFYLAELLWMEVAAGILVICCSLWFSSYLLSKKVTV